MIPYFLIDEELVDLQETLKDVIVEIRHPHLSKNVQFLRKFVLAAASTFVKERPMLKTPEGELMEIKPIKEEPEIIKKLQPQKPLQMQLVEVPVGYEVYPTPEPGKGLQVYSAKPVIHKKMVHPHSEYIILIKDYMENKVLASAEANEIYKVHEPILTPNDEKVFDKVISKNAKNMKEGWELIEYYAEKYEARDLTNIKYYVANKLFALGEIEPLLHDDHISSISCSGVNKFVEIVYEGRKLKTNLLFKTQEDLNSFLLSIAKKTNNKLDKDNPTLDTQLRGFRVHCVFGIETSSKFTLTRI